MSLLFVRVPTSVLETSYTVPAGYSRLSIRSTGVSPVLLSLVSGDYSNCVTVAPGLSLQMIELVGISVTLYASSGLGLTGVLEIILS